MSEWHINNRAWARTRLRVLNEEGWKCRLCGNYANEVDHKQPVWKGGSEYERDNLQAICRGCHIEKTRKERGVSPSLIAGEKAWDNLISEKVKL